MARNGCGWWEAELLRASSVTGAIYCDARVVGRAAVCLQAIQLLQIRECDMAEAKRRMGL
jgi:hypothetical protein